MWEFGDGTRAYSRNVEHTWQVADVYNITLTVADCYGNRHVDIRNITIRSKAPEIIGPFGFKGIEGQALALDVEVYDNEEDEPFLKYCWYDEKGGIFSTDPCPTVVLDDGKYLYTLVVIDPTGAESREEITIEIHSRAPQLYIADYMYHGVGAEFFEAYSDGGEIELTAYALDSIFDNEYLEFYWTIRKNTAIYTIADAREQSYSTVIFRCAETTTYQGQVRVVDRDGNERVASAGW